MYVFACVKIVIVTSIRSEEVRKKYQSFELGDGARNLEWASAKAMARVRENS